MKVEFIPEPALEFGGENRHVDIRFGLMHHGPIDVDTPTRPSQINVGIVGSSESIEGFSRWLESCKAGVPAKTSKQPNLFPRFPGCDKDTGLRAELLTPVNLQATLNSKELSKLARLPGLQTKAEAAVEMLYSSMKTLTETYPQMSVIVCAVPLELVNAIEEAATEGEDPDTEEDAREEAGSLKYDYRDMLKARMMELRKPIQIIRPGTYDKEKRKAQKARPDRMQTTQDEATIAWNLHTALYYKAGGVPWRLLRDSTALTACYVGVSFYSALDKGSIRTSIAQVFNERGEGVIVRGGAARISQIDKTPHLSGEDAESLLKTALQRYRDIHKTLPARVVMHKSSYFDDDELRGFQAALESLSVNDADFMSLSSSHVKLSRVGDYPPLRGTLLSLAPHDLVLYTKGSVEFFQTWPGMHVPSPKRVRIASANETPRFLAQEILALSKMNWNNTQFDGSEPITLRAARQVSKVLRYCPENQLPETRYSFYM